MSPAREWTPSSLKNGALSALGSQISEALTCIENSYNYTKILRLSCKLTLNLHCPYCPYCPTITVIVDLQWLPIGQFSSEAGSKE